MNGQWGFAIWDAKQRKLFLPRDRLGVRPVFYALAGNNLLFGSEIKSIFAHPAVDRELDLAALDQTFTFWCTIPRRTIFKNICELPPGHSLTFQDGKLQVHAYWHLDFDGFAQDATPEGEYAEHLEALLTDAIRIWERSVISTWTTIWMSSRSGSIAGDRRVEVSFSFAWRKQAVAVDPVTHHRIVRPDLRKAEGKPQYVGAE